MMQAARADGAHLLWTNFNPAYGGEVIPDAEQMQIGRWQFNVMGRSQTGSVGQGACADAIGEPVGQRHAGISRGKQFLAVKFFALSETGAPLPNETRHYIGPVTVTCGDSARSLARNNALVVVAKPASPNGHWNLQGSRYRPFRHPPAGFSGERGRGIAVLPTEAAREVALIGESQ